MLDDHHVAPGEEVGGRIALYNPRGRAIYDLDVLIAHAYSVVPQKTALTHVLRAIPALSRRSGFMDGEGLDFVLRVPVDALPGVKVAGPSR